MTLFADQFAAALSARQGLIAHLHEQHTDAYRLFHGTNEGLAGVTVDRYGPQLLIQSFHHPITAEHIDIVRQQVADCLGFDPLLVYNDRSGHRSRVQRVDEVHTPSDAALAPLDCREWGVRYRVLGRHRGHDPLLFLDLRNARRLVLEHCAGQSVLNLFSYTCGVGLCAAQGGASEVWNVDFAASSLAHGQENAGLNGLDETKLKFVQSDYFPAIYQLAGLPIRARRGKRLPYYPKLEARQFDWVFLDPPRWAKSPFGTVDLVRDYQSVLKPALLAAKPGGKVVCCNNVAQVALEDWLPLLRRCGEKWGRPVKSIDIIEPAVDFPSRDGRHPLKTAVLQL